jgi:Carbohydrate binding domain
MKNRMVKVLVMGLLALAGTFSMVAAEGNILKNPGFELSQNGLPIGWNVMNGISQDAKMTVSKLAPHSGTSCLTIENMNPTDTMIIQNLAVQPEKVYHVSGWLKTDNIQNQPGSANITLFYVNNGYGCKGIYTSTEYQNTGNRWIKMEFYIRTLKESAPLTLGIRLGGQGTKNQGKVSFDDLSVELVNNPAVAVNNFFIPTNVNSGNAASASNPGNNSPSSSSHNILLFAVLGIIGLGVLIYFEHKVTKSKQNESK